MMKTQRRHATGIVRCAGFVALLAMASLAFAGQALASAPTGEYSIYSDCPYENLSVKQCNYSETTSGEVLLNSTRVPITHKLLLQGGSTLNFETEKEQFYAAKDGVTLSKAGQSVEGGLANLIPKKSLPEWLWPAYAAVFENGISGVTAVTELAKPASEIGISASNLAAGEGVALELPVKVHLENPFLGSSCYIGSSSNPIVLKLTTGTTSPKAPNKPLAGFPGNFEFAAEGAILNDTGYKLVDNNFSAPAATGCGGFLVELILDPILNGKVGLPSAAGKNTAILTGNLKRAYAPAVRASVK
jgi:hypothetical protein